MVKLRDKNLAVYSILAMNFLIVILASEQTDKFFPFDKFEDNLNLSPLQSIRAAAVSKHFTEVFHKLITSLSSKTEFDQKYSSAVINYIKQGLEFLKSMAHNEFYTELNGLTKSFKNNSVVKMAKKLENIEADVEFIVFFLAENDHLYNSTFTEKFLNYTIYSTDFQNNFEKLHLSNLSDFFFDFKRPTEKIISMFFVQIIDQVDFPKFCGCKSIAELMFDLYEKLISDVIKFHAVKLIGYNLMQFKESNYEVYQNQQRHVLAEYSKSIRDISLDFRGVQNLFTREHKIYRNCDPPAWKEGKNYIRVKNYVSNLNGYKIVNLKSGLLKNQIDEEFECPNYALFHRLDHVSIDSHRCPEVFETLRDTNIIYCTDDAPDYFANPSGGYSNWNMSCVDSGIYHNMYRGFCYCDRQSDIHLSVRHICIDEQYTDSSKSLIVTGIRFVVKFNVITIEIQEGKLMNGSVDPKTVRWVTFPSVKCSKIVKLHSQLRSFNMDDVELLEGHFVTGVKFLLMQNGSLTLVVRGSSMWNNENHWSNPQNTWFYPSFYDKELRESIAVRDYLHPLESKGQNYVISRSGLNYVDLSVGLSFSEHNNLPVIPFFDSQEVKFDPPMPLSGMGIYYKGQFGYGGFFALQIFASDFTFNAEAELSS